MARARQNTPGEGTKPDDTATHAANSKTPDAPPETPEAVYARLMKLTEYDRAQVVAAAMRGFEDGKDVYVRLMALTDDQRERFWHTAIRDHDSPAWRAILLINYMRERAGTGVMMPGANAEIFEMINGLHADYARQMYAAGAEDHKRRRDAGKRNEKRDDQIVRLHDEEKKPFKAIPRLLLTINPDWCDEDGNPISKEAAKLAYRRRKAFLDTQQRSDTLG